MKFNREILGRFVAGVAGMAAILALPVTPATAVEFDPDGLIRVESAAPADSLTVGQRFRVVHTFAFPDSLAMVSVAEFKTGKCRLVSADWTDAATAGAMSRTLTLDLLALELDAARVPEQTFDFTTPSGDTLRVFTRDFEIPIRLVTAENSELVPLKEQWEAPGSNAPWITAGAAALALAILAWWRRRRRRKPELDLLAPGYPADYEALTELTRIEGLGLLDKAEYKHYYTLVVDAIRHYLEKRFRIDAMDRTSDELLMDLEARGVSVESLPAFLSEADLVKFAKYQPQRENGDEAMRTARAIVVDTTPRVTEEADAAPAVASGGGA